MMKSSAHYRLFLFLVLLLFEKYGTIIAVQLRTECEDWANAGECDANPGYMWKHCETSCEKQEKLRQEDIGHITSFFDLSAEDIDGSMVDFSAFRGKVTIVVNVASYCGYTQEHYKELVELHRSLADTGMVEILAFPCNQFNHQEPDDCRTIKRFALGKGVEFKMMYKIEVNGMNADPVYKYLKKVAGPHNISWNFATYFVIGPFGEVQSFSSVKPNQLEEVARELLSEEL